MQLAPIIEKIIILDRFFYLVEAVSVEFISNSDSQK